MKKQTGFTLTELMITVAVGAILSAVAVPSFSNLIKQSNIDTMSHQIYSEWLLWRSEALKQHKNLYVCASSDNQTCSHPTSNQATSWSDGYIAFVRSSTAQADTWPDISNGDEIISINNEIRHGFIFKNNQSGLVKINHNGTTNNYEFTLCASDSDESIGKTIKLSASGRPSIIHAVTGQCEARA